MWCAMNKIKEFCSEIIIISLSICAGLISMLYSKITPGEQYLVWSLGALISIVVALIKRDIVSRFDKKIEIYRLLETIGDNELRLLGLKFFNECKHKIEDLSKGIYTGNYAEIFTQAIIRLNHVKDKVQATHVVSSKKHLYIFEESPILMNYYTENVNLVKRKKIFERIFIIDCPEIIDPKDRIIRDERCKNILQKHKNDKIEVTIILRDDLQSPDLSEDFIIFDNSMVQIERLGTINDIYRQVTFSKRSFDIEYYQNKFTTMKHHGQSLDKFLNNKIDNSYYAEKLNNILSFSWSKKVGL